MKNSIKNKLLKENKAITLIALVITIIVLLIIAAVTLNLVLGENGLFSKAKQAKEDYKTAEENEELKMAQLYNQMNEYISGNSRDTFTFTAEELQTYVDGKINDAIKIEKLSNNSITFNSEYINTSSSNTYLDIYKSGKTVFIDFCLELKKDVGTNGVNMISGLPKTVTSNGIFYGRDAENSRAICFNLNTSNNSDYADLYCWWNNPSISCSGPNKLRGSFSYLSE